MNKLPPTDEVSASDEPSNRRSEPAGTRSPSARSTEHDSKTPLELPNEQFGLRSHDQLFLAAFVVIVLLLTMLQWLTLSGWNQQSIEINRLPERKYDFRININEAGWVEWTQIEGIGEATARHIVEDREEKGPFRSLSDLRRVKGIGDKTLERIKPYLRVGSVSAEETKETDRP